MEYIKCATKMHILTASMYYVVAKVKGYTLLDVDMLPLEGEHWQTDQMMSAYLSLVTSCFSTPDKLILTLDFMVVRSIYHWHWCHMPSGARSTVTTKLSK